MTILKDKRVRRDAPMINERIRATSMQVITHEGNNIGVISRADALQIASDANLDLVLLSEGGDDGVPVVKIMDFGKALYEKKKKQAKAKKQQKVIQVKEVKMRPKISDHDFMTKIKQVAQFLREGKRVKITLSFRGRENAQRGERGTELFNRINAVLEEQECGGKVAHEQDSSMGQFWSRVYYIK